MNFIRSRFDRYLGLALLATLGLAFAPTVSRMVLPSLDHCAATMLGHDMAAMGRMASTAPTSSADHDLKPFDAGPQTPTHAPATLDHCDLCAVAALACTVTAVMPVLGACTASHADPADVQHTAPERRTEWSAATWRGPPATA